MPYLVVTRKSQRTEYRSHQAPVRKRFTRTSVRKANPTPGDVHISAPLTNISVAYVQDQSNYVASQAFPVVPVSFQSNQYYLYDKSDFLRDEARPRAPGTESAGSGFKLATQNYSCLVEAIHKDLDDQVRANQDGVLNLDEAGTQWVTQKLLLRRELKWMGKFFTTGVWGTDITPGTLWSAANSTPGADVEVGKVAILTATGFEPNTLVLGYPVYSALRRNAEIRDQLKYTSSKSIDTEMMAEFFGVDRVLVAKAAYESAKEGATSSMALVAGKGALLCYSAPSPSLLLPTAGYTFAWTGFTGGVEGWRIKRIRADLINSDRIEGEHALDMQAVAASMGYFFNGAVA